LSNELSSKAQKTEMEERMTNTRSTLNESATQEMSTFHKNIIGRYRLLSHGTYNFEGEFTPTSEFISGELIYAGEGYLSVIIFFNRDTQENRKFLAYSGLYEMTSPNEVIHKISICSKTNRNSTSENRNYKLIDNFLFLSCPLEESS
jgi:hypothetical protein